MKNYIKHIIILLISVHLVDYAMDKPSYFNGLPGDTKAIILRECWSSTYHEIRQLRCNIYQSQKIQTKNDLRLHSLASEWPNYSDDCTMVNLMQENTNAKQKEEQLQKILNDAKCCLYSFALVNKDCNKFFFDLQFRYLQSMTELNEDSSVEEILNLLSITPRAPAISCPVSCFVSIDFLPTMSSSCIKTLFFSKEVLSSHCFDFWHCFTKGRELVEHVITGEPDVNSSRLFFKLPLYTYMRLNGLIVAILKTDSELFSEVLMKKYSSASTDMYKESDLSNAKIFLDFLLLKQLSNHETFLEMHNKFCAEIV